MTRYSYFVLIIDRQKVMDFRWKLVSFVRLFSWFRYAGLMKDINKGIFNEKCNCFNERCGILRGYTFPQIGLFLTSWWWFVNQLDITVCKWICGKYISLEYGESDEQKSNNDFNIYLSFLLLFRLFDFNKKNKWIFWLSTIYFW